MLHPSSNLFAFSFLAPHRARLASTGFFFSFYCCLHYWNVWFSFNDLSHFCLVFFALFTDQFFSPWQRASFSHLLLVLREIRTSIFSIFQASFWSWQDFGYRFLGASFILLKNHSLAKAGSYKYIRHPQYVAFIIIMLGFLLQWPTLITLIMFPILVLLISDFLFVKKKHSKKFWQSLPRLCGKDTKIFSSTEIILFLMMLKNNNVALGNLLNGVSALTWFISSLPCSKSVTFWNVMLSPRRQKIFHSSPRNASGFFLFNR